MFETLVDALAVAAVFLVDDPNDIGVLGGIGVGNGAGTVGGAVVNNDDLHAIPAGQQGIQTDMHIVCGIITGNGK